ncbi:MAG: GNAT family N-acetyltransferase [Bacteroidetes bacterium]|nr:MAG: GNAT family N-acetyltransferase [Bacteroidota bacterium]
MPSAVLHPARPSDIDRILAMMERFYAIDGYPFRPERTRRALEEFIAEPRNGSLWLITADTQTAGYAVLATVYSFEFGGKNAFIDELYLEPEFRGRGIGLAAVEHLVRTAAESGITALHLETEHHNTAAIELYRRFGFEDHHRVLMTRMLIDD